MKECSGKTRAVSLFIGLSLVLHGIVGYAISRFGTYDFALPVEGRSPIVVELLRGAAFNPVRSRVPSTVPRNPFPQTVPFAGDAERGEPTVAPEVQGHAFEGGVAADAGQMGSREVEDDVGDERGGERGDGGAVKPEDETLHELENVGAFLATTHEKLTYQLSLFGLPVGSAVLEAVSRENEIRITMSAQSNAVISSIYPVNDFAETRLIGGKYIVSNFRQQEGGFRSDTGFTLCLPLRSVLWTDRLARVVMSRHLDELDVLDIISAFYYLRNQPLEVGTPLHLRIFDRQKIIDAPVEVLRRERTALPGFREVNALVIRPVLPTDGLFRRSGELLVWLTDDQYKVPVRMETSIALGKVTAELVSAKSERQKQDPGRAQGSNRED